MIKNSLYLLPIIFILICQPAAAHPGGHGPVGEKEAIYIASDVAQQFIDFDAGLGFGKLSDSWKNIPVQQRQIHKKGNGYYIVSITNNNEGKILYILLSDEGEVYDANFSGVFAGLK